MKSFQPSNKAQINAWRAIMLVPTKVVLSWPGLVYRGSATEFLLPDDEGHRVSDRSDDETFMARRVAFQSITFAKGRR